MDPSVRRERSKSIAAPGMPAGPNSSGSHMRQGSAGQAQLRNQLQYRSASPNPYSAATQPSGRARSQTSGNVYANAPMGSQVQLAQASGEMAMYEAPGNADVSPSVCFMGKFSNIMDYCSNITNFDSSSTSNV